jgi:hypothetical protein
MLEINIMTIIPELPDLYTRRRGEATSGRGVVPPNDLIALVKNVFFSELRFFSSGRTGRARAHLIK